MAYHSNWPYKKLSFEAGAYPELDFGEAHLIHCIDFSCGKFFNTTACYRKYYCLGALPPRFIPSKSSTIIDIRKFSYYDHNPFTVTKMLETGERIYIKFERDGTLHLGFIE